MKTLEELGRIATGRAGSHFDPDFTARSGDLSFARLSGARVLVIGGAGSIGSATVKELTRFPVGALHVVDISENNLVELVRDLRGSSEHLPQGEFRALPIDYGSPVFERFLRGQARYDLVLNFAALKHVRSEKDVCSLLQMIDTNIVKQARLLGWLAAQGGTDRYFSVSTDKAANPVNLMGATKLMMEHVIFSAASRPAGIRCVTSARFANVAFSDGSLLFGWVQRMAKLQPLAAPIATCRYLISLREAGQICLLATICGEDKDILIPKLDPSHDLRELAVVAREFLAVSGFRAREYSDEAEARARVVADMADGCYPLLLTPLDTDGEKPFEEFVGEGEVARKIGIDRLCAVRHVPAAPEQVERFLKLAESMTMNPDVAATKAEIIAALEDVIPQFRHHCTGESLDDRL